MHETALRMRELVLERWIGEAPNTRAWRRVLQRRDVAEDEEGGDVLERRLVRAEENRGI